MVRPECSNSGKSIKGDPVRVDLIAGTWALVLFASVWSDVAVGQDGAYRMSMDSQLLEADFAGEVEVLALSSVADASSPQWEVRLLVDDVWFSRWSVDKATLEFRVRAGAVWLEEGRHYVVLMSGGPYRETPFTFAENSVFSIDTGREVHCASGNPLFAVLPAGFLCSVRPLVLGEPLDVNGMRAQLERARMRAEQRQPDVAHELDVAGRELASEPEHLEGPGR